MALKMKPQKMSLYIFIESEIKMLFKHVGSLIMNYCSTLYCLNNTSNSIGVVFAQLQTIKFQFLALQGENVSAALSYSISTIGEGSTRLSAEYMR